MNYHLNGILMFRNVAYGWRYFFRLSAAVGICFALEWCMSGAIDLRNDACETHARINRVDSEQPFDELRNDRNTYCCACRYAKDGMKFILVHMLGDVTRWSNEVQDLLAG